MAVSVYYVSFPPGINWVGLGIILLMAIIIKTTTTATEKKKEEKKFRINYRMNQNKGMIMNAFPGSQLSVSFPLL